MNELSVNRSDVCCVCCACCLPVAKDEGEERGDKEEEEVGEERAATTDGAAYIGDAAARAGSQTATSTAG